MGTNECEGCLFVMLAPIVDKHITIPITDDGVGWIEKHMVSYHDNWNATTTAQVNAAYPSAQFSSGNFRFDSMLTDFIFACGTRTAVRNLADQGAKGHGGGARAKEVDSDCRGAGTHVGAGGGGGRGRGARGGTYTYSALLSVHPPHHLYMYIHIHIHVWTTNHC